jgi:hypothetical protein
MKNRWEVSERNLSLVVVFKTGEGLITPSISVATGDLRMKSWIQAHVHAFEFYCGVPSLIVPDNARTGVTRACRYDPDLNPTYQEMARIQGSFTESRVRANYSGVARQSPRSCHRASSLL